LVAICCEYIVVKLLNLEELQWGYYFAESGCILLFYFLQNEFTLRLYLRFGKGPHKVEIEIEYPRYVEGLEGKDWPRVRGVFLIELAPLDLMPVAVHMFLQQVHHKLWNGCSFVINAMHILQAGPHKHVKSHYVPNEPELFGKFTAAKLDKMPFQEYDARYPHEKYTLGMSGRPGGPDFYINKVNNTINHGPGGQKIHDLHEETDPCFGKVIGGTELLDEIGKIPIDYQTGGTLLHQVLIVDARIVTEAHNPYQDPNHVHIDDDYHKDHAADIYAEENEEQRDEPVVEQQREEEPQPIPETGNQNDQKQQEQHDEPVIEQHQEEPQQMTEAGQQRNRAGPGPSPV
jgi:cyclophilin family peptidyl-prolyl cis-trans isomerase